MRKYLRSIARANMKREGVRHIDRIFAKLWKKYIY